MSCRETTKPQETCGKHNGLANSNCFLQGNFGKVFFKLEVGELANPSSSSAVDFREHFLPVSATVMLFSSLVLIRCYVFPLPVSATVMLFSSLVLVRCSVFPLPVSATVFLFSSLVLVRCSVFPLPVSATVMLFSSLVLIRCSAFSLPVSATVMLFPRLVLVRFFVFLTCLYAFMDV